MKTIVFIHGMYMNGRSWHEWQSYFQALGYDCRALSWPFHEGSPSELRANPAEGLGTLNLQDVVDYCSRYIQDLALPDKPIIIGHSIGGLVTQLLVNQGLASHAICISSAPPFGIIPLRLDFYRSNFPHINPFAGNAPCFMTLKRFRYTFCNTMTSEDTARAFEQYVVPESRNVPRSLLTTAAKIDFAKPHVPLLFLAGDSDHLVPASLNQRNVDKYAPNSGTIDFKLLPQRGHMIYAQPRWEEVADATHQWLMKHSA